jgi:hypothetical protein
MSTPKSDPFIDVISPFSESLFAPESLVKALLIVHGRALLLQQSWKESLECRLKAWYRPFGRARLGVILWRACQICRVLRERQTIYFA